MTDPVATSRRPRFAPSVALAVAVWLAYSAITFVVQATAGVGYADWFKTAANAWRTAVASLAVGIVLLVAFLSVARWDHVFRDPARLPTSRWMVAGMAIWWTLIAIRFAGIRWGDVPPDLLVPVVTTGVLVGFAEEVLFRGIVLRGLREGGRPEASAATLTAIAFGLLHLPNVFVGTGVAGLAQVPVAAMSGMTLYAFRRWSGSLLPAMVAHGVWDISTFLSSNYAASWHEPFTLGGLVVSFAVGLTLFVTVLRHDRSTVALPPPH